MKILLTILLLTTTCAADTVPIQDVLPGWTQDYQQPVSELIALRREAGETSGYVCVGTCFKLPEIAWNWNYIIPAAVAVALPPLLSLAFDGGGDVAVIPSTPSIVPPPDTTPVPESRTLVLLVLGLGCIGTRKIFFGQSTNESKITW